MNQKLTKIMTEPKYEYKTCPKSPDQKDRYIRTEDGALLLDFCPNQMTLEEHV